MIMFLQDDWLRRKYYYMIDEQRYLEEEINPLFVLKLKKKFHKLKISK